MRTWTSVVTALTLGGLGALGVSAAACGSSSAPFASGNDTASDSGSATSDATADDGGGGFTGDDGPGVFAGDDGGAALTLDCKPGTYKGTFSTKVTNGDAGGLFSLFSFAWTGTLSITLAQVTMMDNSGELPTTTLMIAPGAQVNGLDSMGGHFTADLAGKLDCPSRVLTGTLTNGIYAFFGDAGIGMQGSLSGSYDGTKNPPSLTGAITASSPQVPQSVAAGSWTATLQ